MHLFLYAHVYKSIYYYVQLDLQLLPQFKRRSCDMF